MSTLETWILSVLLSIAPEDATRRKAESSEELKARYTSIAADMAAVVQESKPLYGEDPNGMKTAAMLLAIAQFESGGFSKRVDTGAKKGDNGKSVCLMQVNMFGGHLTFGSEEMRAWTGDDLIADRKKCFKAGLEALRISTGYCGKTAKKQDPSSRLNLYVKGQRQGFVDCELNKHAKHRWDLAHHIRTKYPFPAEPVAEATKPITGT